MTFLGIVLQNLCEGSISTDEVLLSIVTLNHKEGELFLLNLGLYLALLHVLVGGNVGRGLGFWGTV